MNVFNHLLPLLFLLLFPSQPVLLLYVFIAEAFQHFPTLLGLKHIGIAFQNASSLHAALKQRIFDLFQLFLLGFKPFLNLFLLLGILDFRNFLHKILFC